MILAFKREDEVTYLSSKWRYCHCLVYKLFAVVGLPLDELCLLRCDSIYYSRNLPLEYKKAVGPSRTR